MAAKAGWYPDTQVADGERYWDGSRWTDQKRQALEPFRPAPGSNSAGRAAARRGQWTANTYTLVGICLLLLSGLVFGAVGEAVDYGTATVVTTIMVSLGTGFLLVAIIGIGVRVGLRDARND
jgi:hypothetical protein